ncbi:uncharacterized protein K452DRAFT_287983, partial [Aplosporella prunicola CBS 121167]
MVYPASRRRPVYYCFVLLVGWCFVVMSSHMFVPPTPRNPKDECSVCCWSECLSHGYPLVFAAARNTQLQRYAETPPENTPELKCPPIV